MFRYRNHADTLGDAVDALLSLLTPHSMDVLMEMQEDELQEIQGMFAKKLCEYLDLEEGDLVDLCCADDVDTAAARLAKAAWAEARVRRLQ